jgi:hypothetical protein
VDGKKYIAACDCTGHGVPGALMSMVATDMLNEALVHTKKVDEILAHTNRSIRVALKQSTDDDSTRDGMDIALCCFNDKTNMLQFQEPTDLYGSSVMLNKIQHPPPLLPTLIHSFHRKLKQLVRLRLKAAMTRGN